MAGDTWIFGYGSLIWRPDFDYAERCRATLSGYHRSFCMASVRYRGTPEAPGLVLALDRQDGAACSGVAYRIEESASLATLAYLRDRELISYAYDEHWLPVTLEDDRNVDAVTYVVNRTHEQYRGGLSLAAQADVIARAQGPMGSNRDYLMNTVAGLAALGLDDPDLSELCALVARIDRHTGRILG